MSPSPHTAQENATKYHNHTKNMQPGEMQALHSQVLFLYLNLSWHRLWFYTTHIYTIKNVITECLDVNF